ncbi:MAG: hypothetical protein C0625_10475 [Arcobacter sp.]|nr:MAG: hypothetical protein C0625_10475 [Arcobacter sp.]
MQLLKNISSETLKLLDELENILKTIDENIISTKRNSQDRTIKQIIGHLVDSASNNTHRVIHLQYQESPLIFPDYANLGVNDKWIVIQDYNNYNLENLVQLMKYTNIHITNVIKNIDTSKLRNKWISALGNVRYCIKSKCYFKRLFFDLEAILWGIWAFFSGCCKKVTV